MRSLADWNGLSSDFAVREGQFLLIPVARASAESTPATEPDTTTVPGQGSPTPTPPSAVQPLPKDDTTPAHAATPPQNVDIGQTTAASATKEGQFAFPVKGTIIRDYAKGKNEGINIKAAPGTPVNAAAAGTVAAITKSEDGVPIIVVRHTGNLLTVYANVTDVSVKKGDTLRRGQPIAKLRDGNQSFVHFEVRDGFDSVDPNTFLNG